MEIQLPKFQKKITGPIPDHYAEINIQPIKLKPGENSATRWSKYII